MPSNKLDGIVPVKPVQLWNVSANILLAGVVMVPEYKCFGSAVRPLQY